MGGSELYRAARDRYKLPAPYATSATDVGYAATHLLVPTWGMLLPDLGPHLQRGFHEQVLPALTAAMDAGREGSERVRAHAAAVSTTPLCPYAISGTDVEYHSDTPLRQARC